MAEPNPVVIDAFKFVAIGPQQLPTEADTPTSQSTDARSATPEGMKHLTELLHDQLGSTEAARRAYNGLDLSALRPLAEGRRALVQAYGQLEATASLDPKTALASAGIDAALSRAAAGFAVTAGDAIYAGYATGADAGRLLQKYEFR